MVFQTLEKNYCRGKSILVAEFFMFCAGLASQKGDVAQVAEIRLQILMRGNYLPNIKKEVLPWSPSFVVLWMAGKKV